MSILIVSLRPSQLSGLLEESFPESRLCAPEELCGLDVGEYDAVAVLGGADGEPLVLTPPQRRRIEARIAAGGRVFLEFVTGVDNVDMTGTAATRYARPWAVDGSGLGLDLPRGLLLEEQSNTRMTLRPTGRTREPILQYADNPRGFYEMENADRAHLDETRYALWLERDNLLCCAFRMADFGLAKFSPQGAWSRLISAIVRWLGGECGGERALDILTSAYRMRGRKEAPLETALRGMAWFDRADMIVREGGAPYAVREGLSAYVFPDGRHQMAGQLRPDCGGEAAMMYFMKYALDGDGDALERADGLMRFPLDMQVPDGPRAGWVGWTPTARFACYQDDVARGFLLPELWRAYLSGDQSRLGPVKKTLDYLLSTTGSDGLRMCRTDYTLPEDDKLRCTAVRRRENGGKWDFRGVGQFTPGEMRSQPSGCPSAHYNGFYLASLLLCAKLTGEKKYLEAGRRGLKSLMAAYPETAREHSETQELCRLILPLAMLYWSSDDEEEKGWLYRVTDDLERLKHKNGGFTEWDTGYIAVCAGVKDGESSVLCENGDPVADMLYSLNWLPMGFAAAWLATGDERFHALWQDAADFFGKCQILSDNPQIDGAWPRSMDLDRFEVYGVPNDVGWAPWSVESGWTMAEIVSGLLLGLIVEKRG